MKQKNANEEPTKVNAKACYPLKERLLISFLSVFTFVFVVFIFGPIDIFANNMAELSFAFKDFMPWLMAISMLILCFLTAYFTAMRSWIFNMLTGLIMILPVGGCLQLLIFGSIGELNGSHKGSDIKTSIAVTILWLAVAAAIMLSAFLGKKKWKSIVVFISVLMVGMNGVTLVTDFINHDILSSQGVDYDYVLSNKNLLSLSKDENIVVILTDSLDNMALDSIYGNDPEFAKKLENELEGFTYYTGATSLYGRTFPSVPYMITGNEFTGEVSVEDYLASTYKNSDFLSDLKKNGYDINLFIKSYYTYTDAESLLGVAENVAESTGYTVEKLNASKCLMNFSLARNLPRNMTRLTYAFTDNASASFSVTINCGDGGMYYANDPKMYSRLLETGLSADEGSAKNYTFLHLNGAHEPYTVTSDCKEAEKKTDAIQQSEGVLTLVMEYINQMKKLGVYDNSTIIVAADHGLPNSDMYLQLDGKQTVALFIKPRGSERQPMKYSAAQVSHTNFLATIVQDASLKTDVDYGTSIFDIAEGTNTVRRYNRFVFMNGSRSLAISDYTITGDANDFKNWKYNKTTETQWEWY